MTFFENVDWSDIGQACLDTLIMLGGSLVLTILLGLPLGVLLYLTGKGRLIENRLANGALGIAVNILRSVPFIILLIVMIPLTVLLVGTSLGVAGAIPPLVVGAAAFAWRSRPKTLKLPSLAVPAKQPDTLRILPSMPSATWAWRDTSKCS